MIVPEYTTGDWYAVVTDGSIAFLAPTTEREVVDDVWLSLCAGADPTVQLQSMLRVGLAAMPPFALVTVVGGSVRVIVRGSAIVTVTTLDGDHIIDAGRASTWIEDAVVGATAISVVTPDLLGSARESGLPVLSAVVKACAISVVLAGDGTEMPVTAPPGVSQLASGRESEFNAMGAGPELSLVPQPLYKVGSESVATFPWRPEPLPASELDVLAEPLSGPLPGSLVDAELEPVVGPETELVPVSAPEPEPESAPEPDAARGTDAGAQPQPEVEAGTQLEAGREPQAELKAGAGAETASKAGGETVLDDLESTMLVPATADAATPEAEGELSFVAPLVLGDQAAGDDHDGQTVMTSNIVELRTEQPEKAESKPRSSAKTTASERSSATTGASESSGPGRIVLSSGMIVSLNRPVLIGRAPKASRVAKSKMPRLVSVPSPNNDVSRTHAQVRQEGDDILVTDLNSTNGVMIVREGASPQRLHPGEPAVVEPGVVVDLGDDVTFTVEKGS